MTTTTASPDSRPSTPGRGYRRAWAALPGNALFLVLLSLPFALVGLGVNLGVFVVGVATLVLVIGLPILAVSLHIARGFAEAERALLRITDTPPIDAPDWHRGSTAAGFRARVMHPLRNAHYWTALLSSVLVRPIVSVLAFAIATAWLAISLGGPTYWFWSSFIPGGNAEEIWVPWAVQHLFGGIDPSPDPRLWASMIYLVVGILFLTTLPVVLEVLVRLHRTTAAALTGRWESDDLAAQVEGLGASLGAAAEAEDAGLRRLERDLHDGPQQRLVRLQMDLASLERRAAEGDAAAVAALAQESRAHAQAALDELRALAGGVAPPLLQDRGIVEAITGLAAASSIPVRTDVAPELATALSPEAERNVYFVVAELLTNAAKHAHADAVTVAAHRDDDVIHVSVWDDGRGGADPRAGSGLEGLLRRVQGMRGRMHIDSPIGGPTLVTVTVPVSA